LKTQQEPLSRWIAPDTSPPRVERMWSRLIEEDERRSRPVWPRLVITTAAVAAVAVVAFIAWPRTAHLEVGGHLEAVAQNAEGRFNDGSRVELAKGSALALAAESPQEMRIDLSHGVATFEVARRPSRRFIVRAANVEVRVVGTRFTVNRDGEHVEVAVERGIVEVQSGDTVTRLGAGQQWSTHEVASATEALSPMAGGVSEALAVPRASPLRHEPLAVKRHGSSRQAASVAPAAAPAASGGAAPVAAVETSAAELFDAALKARREGRSSDAALLLERILRDHADDTRASLAAFELGRLRMDALDDERGASEALELSLVLSSRAPFAEEALLRLTKSYDSRGLKAPCVHARDQYLSRFPDGAYVTSIKARCGR
jgi:hypothetical protein